MEFEHLYVEILSPLFWNMDTFNLNLKELNVYITLVSIYHSSAFGLRRNKTPYLYEKKTPFLLHSFSNPTQNRNVLVLLFLKTNARLIKCKSNASKLRDFFVTQICLYRNQLKCASTEICCRLPA